MRVLGTSAVLRSTRYLKSLSGFLQVVRVYEGTEAAITALTRRLTPDQSYDFDMSQAPAKCVLTVSTPDEASVDSNLVYELLGNTIQKDLLEHPALAYYSGREFPRMIEFGASGGDDQYNTAKTKITSRCTELTKDPALALAFLEMYAKGTKHYQVSNYVLRVINTVSRKTSLKVAFANVETIYSTAQLLREIGSPQTIAFSIKEVSKVEDDPWDNYTLGWLKQTPTVHQIGGGRFQINIEYILEQWSTILYPLSSAPS